METNEILFRASCVMENGGTKPANDLRVLFGFNHLAALEATHDVPHDSNSIDKAICAGACSNRFASEPHRPAVSSQTTRECFAAFFQHHCMLPVGPS